MGVPLEPNGEQSLRVSASMMTLVAVSGLLRLWARLKKGQRGIPPEDILIIFASVIYIVEQCIWLYDVMGPGGAGGSDLFAITPAQVDRFFYYLYVQQILLTPALMLTKLFLLTFMRRIFWISKHYIRFNWFIMIVTILWGMAILFVIIFQCSPIHAMWNRKLAEKLNVRCIDSAALAFAFQMIHITIDLSILIPPIWMINRLQLPPLKKAYVMGIFLVGGFVIITSALRAYYIWNPSTGRPRYLPTAMNWTCIEVASAIVVTNLPTYGPLLAVHSFFERWYSEARNTITTKVFRRPVRKKDSLDSTIDCDVEPSNADTIVPVDSQGEGFQRKENGEGTSEEKRMEEGMSNGVEGGEVSLENEKCPV